MSPLRVALPMNILAAPRGSAAVGIILGVAAASVIAVCASGGGERSVGRVLGEAQAHHNAGQHDDAYRLYEEVIATAQRGDDEYALFHSHRGLALLHYLQQDYAAAAARMERAVESVSASKNLLAHGVADAVEMMRLAKNAEGVTKHARLALSALRAIALHTPGYSSTSP